MTNDVTTINQQCRLSVVYHAADSNPTPILFIVTMKSMGVGFESPFVPPNLLTRERVPDGYERCCCSCFKVLKLFQFANDHN